MEELKIESEETRPVKSRINLRKVPDAQKKTEAVCVKTHQPHASTSLSPIDEQNDTQYNWKYHIEKHAKRNKFATFAL